MPAIIGPLPALIVDGQLADAGPVMANFNWIVAQVNANAFSSLVFNHGGGNISSNTAYGDGALIGINTFPFNSAFGSNALQTLTTGQTNTAIGSSTLQNATSASANTAIGVTALQGTLTGSLNTAVGISAAQHMDASQNTCIGGFSFNVSTFGNNNTGCGYNSALTNTTGGQNTAIGHSALASNVTGNNNTAIGWASDVTSPGLTNATALGAGALATASNTVTLGNNVITTLFCQVTSITGISDARDKTIVAAMKFGLEFINQLDPVVYRYNNGDDTLRFGFIAQDVEQFLGHHKTALVTRKDDERGTYGMAYTEMIAPLVKAVQELSAQLNDAQARIRKLEGSDE